MKNKSNQKKAMTKGEITKSMLDNLEYDQQNKEMSTKVEIPAAGQRLNTPTAMFVFPNGDLNAAAYHLVNSMKAPFNAGAIVSVFVQEGILQQFIDLLKHQLPAIEPSVKNHAVFKKAMESITRLKAKTIQNDTLNESSVLVCDLTHEHLAGDAASGIVTVHAFRTAKEAISLLAKETLTFENATIWNENHSCAYELVAANCHNFFINCHQVSLEPLKANASGGNNVTLEKSYHYETLAVNGVKKNVVFPVGTIFAN